MYHGFIIIVFTVRSRRFGTCHLLFWGRGRVDIERLPLDFWQIFWVSAGIFRHWKTTVVGSRANKHCNRVFGNYWLRLYQWEGQIVLVDIHLGEVTHLFVRMQSLFLSFPSLFAKPRSQVLSISLLVLNSFFPGLVGWSAGMPAYLEKPQSRTPEKTRDTYWQKYRIEDGYSCSRFSWSAHNLGQYPVGWVLNPGHRVPRRWHAVRENRVVWYQKHPNPATCGSPLSMEAEW